MLRQAITQPALIQKNVNWVQFAVSVIVLLVNGGMLLFLIWYAYLISTADIGVEEMLQAWYPVMLTILAAVSTMAFVFAVLAGLWAPFKRRIIFTAVVAANSIVVFLGLSSIAAHIAEGLWREHILIRESMGALAIINLIALLALVPSWLRFFRLVRLAHEWCVFCLAVLMLCLVAYCDSVSRLATTKRQQFAFQSRILRDIETSGYQIQTVNWEGGWVVYLSLKNQPFGDSDVAPLKGLPYLQSLDLASTSITDDGAEQLAEMKQLKHLYLTDTPVTPEKKQDLLRRNPGLKIH